MANILSILEADAITTPEIQFRGGVPQPLIKVELTFDDEGGEGVSEYVLRNISSNSNARKVHITTAAVPLDPDDGGTLVQEWAFQDPDTDAWGPYRSAVVIDTIEAGMTVRFRTRVIASGTANPTTYRGGVSINYRRSSV